MISFLRFIFVMLIKGTRRQNSKRVLRGGSWINNARNLRSANRNANTPDNRNHNIGFRLAGALLSFFYKEININRCISTVMRTPPSTPLRLQGSTSDLVYLERSQKEGYGNNDNTLVTINNALNNALKNGGSINQSSFPLGNTDVFYLQNQGSLRASKQPLNACSWAAFYKGVSNEN